MSKQLVHVAAVALVGISLIAIGAIAIISPETAASMRVAAVTSAGRSGLSDPATKIAP